MLTHFSSQHLDIAEIMRLHFAVIRIEAKKMFEYLDHNGFTSCVQTWHWMLV